MTDRPSPADASITRVLFFAVRAGKTDAFEALARATNATLTERHGVSAVDVVTPPPGQRLYTLIIRFDSLDALRRWESTDELRALVDLLAPLAERSGPRDHGGMEGWIAVPGRAPPPRWKSVCVSFLAAYPTIAILQGIVMPRLTFLPDAARGVVMGLLMCIVLTYALMPALTRLLSAWLYPAPAHPTAAP